MKKEKRKRKSLLFILSACIILIYLFLLFILLIAERSAGKTAHIQGIGDAFWYSLITLTTVGYGDMYPVTGTGRIVGGVFSLLSLGCLAMLISLLVHCLQSEILPLLLLWLHGNRMWIVFSGDKEYVQPALENCAQEYPDAIMVISNCIDGSVTDVSIENISGKSGRVSIIRMHREITDILKLRKSFCNRKVNKRPDSGIERILLFILNRNDSDNLQLASSIRNAGYTGSVCCRASADTVSGDNAIVCFDEEQIISRRFWMEYGLKNSEKHVVLIGSADEAGSLLEHGLKVNVKKPLQALHYDVYCEDNTFLQYHFGLGKIRNTRPGLWSMMIEDGSGDIINIHTDPWYSDPRTISLADRIILCSADLEKNLHIQNRLEKMIGIPCPVYMRTGNMNVLPDQCSTSSCHSTSLASLLSRKVTFFGLRRTLYTPELMLQEKLDEMARELHSIYCRHSSADTVTKTNSQSEWNALGWFAKASNIAAADHLVKKLEILLKRDDITSVSKSLCTKAYAVFQEIRFAKDQDPDHSSAYKELLEIEHIRWVRFHLLYNWSYADKRDNGLRQHPLLIPFCSLTPEEQEKDAYSWEMIGAITTTSGDSTDDCN